MRKQLLSMAAALFLILCPISVMAEGMVMAKIPVTLDGNAGTKASLHLENVGGNQVEKDLVVQDGDTGYFSIPFDCPGTYRFLVTREQEEKKEGYEYGSEEYYVDVYVTEDKDGKLSTDPIVYIKGKEEKKDACYYTDTKKDPDKPGSSSNASGQKSERADPIQTGDGTPIAELVILCAISLTLFILSVRQKRKSGE